MSKAIAKDDFTNPKRSMSISVPKTPIGPFRLDDRRRHDELVYDLDRAHLPIRDARVEEIVVESNERRGGIGRALLSAARDWAQKNGARSLDLGVYAFNAEAVAFYEREGFSTKVVSLSLPLN